MGLFLLLMVLYVFGIALAQLTFDTSTGDELFSSVGESMYTLLLFGVLSLDYISDISAKLHEVHILLPVVLFIFVLLAPLTIMNMLIGVLCEVVSAVAKIEKESLLVNYAIGKVGQIVESLDTDGDMMISKPEFLKILGNQQACKALHDVGVDVVGLVDFAEVLFWDTVLQKEVHLSFQDFMEIVLNLRSSNAATVKDILSLGRVVRSAIHKLGDRTEEVIRRQKQGACHPEASPSAGIFRSQAFSAQGRSYARKPSDNLMSIAFGSRAS